ncbi:hypothetical protein [Gluconobacter cerinus]|uniref:hypothetical protein n=1 Tax=Gluconobacter cerinus TaxID=38307 RepID=UPI001B8D0FAA|nr:hypothetical protein [Gluconobacter cerinus]MBS1038066.1 hypothetical protein [Gluconobacter cerinus]
MSIFDKTTMVFEKFGRKVWIINGTNFYINEIIENNNNDEKYSLVFSAGDEYVHIASSNDIEEIEKHCLTLAG